MEAGRRSQQGGRLDAEAKAASQPSGRDTHGDRPGSRCACISACSRRWLWPGCRRRASARPRGCLRACARRGCRSRPRGSAAAAATTPSTLPGQQRSGRESAGHWQQHAQHAREAAAAFSSAQAVLASSWRDWACTPGREGVGDGVMGEESEGVAVSCVYQVDICWQQYILLAGRIRVVPVVLFSVSSCGTRRDTHRGATSCVCRVWGLRAGFGLKKLLGGRVSKQVIQK